MGKERLEIIIRAVGLTENERVGGRPNCKKDEGLWLMIGSGEGIEKKMVGESFFSGGE